MKLPDLLMGIFLAVSAALLNATIGIFSKVLMEQGLSVQHIAFLKTLTGFVFISILLCRTGFTRQIADISKKKETILPLLLKVAICAFFGIYTLFFFETTAYQYGNAANVVVVLMASAAVSALILDSILLDERIYISSVVGVGLAVLGIAVISWTGEGSLGLILNAALAGSGYGCFSVLIKKFGLNGGSYLTRILMFFGSIFLFIPSLEGIEDIHWQWSFIPPLLALSLLPTILGFYCTTKALDYLSAAKVQVTELAEPLFAAVLAWMFLNEIPEGRFFVGAILIIAGIVSINGLYRPLLKRVE